MPMPRPLRIEYAGAIYHLMNRGDRREPIFLDDQDRQTFLRTLQEACEKTDWQIHAFCLMGNHFHLVAETPQPNLVAGMKWLLGTYTGRFNRRHEFFGHLFSGRVCWANMASKQTRRRVEVSFDGGWRSGAGKKSRRRWQRRCVGAGAWGPQISWSG